MPQWRVELVGEPFDLEELPELFEHPQLSIQVIDGRYYLCGSYFDALSEADKVRASAREVIQTLNGIARLVYAAYKPAIVGGVVKLDESGQSLFLSVEMEDDLRVKDGLAIVYIDGKPSPAAPRPRPGTAWLARGLATEEGRRALRLLARPKVSWSDLCKVIEIVQSGSGTGLIGTVVSKTDVERITQTANSTKAVGDDARHGHDRFQAPKNPISLADATAVVHKLVRAWLT